MLLIVSLIIFVGANLTATNVSALLRTLTLECNHVVIRQVLQQQDRVRRIPPRRLETICLPAKPIAPYRHCLTHQHLSQRS